MSKREEFVQVAKSQVGTREVGTNNVKYNNWYYGHEVNGRTGTSEYAWCVVFESWCADQVGILNSLVPKENNVGKLQDWYKARGLYHTSNYTPKRGDLIIFKNKYSSASHTGIVEYVDNMVHTIEGNSGDKVATHSYSIWGSSIAGYCEVKFDDGSVTTPTPKPSSSGNERIASIQRVLNSRYNSRLSTDGIYGPVTHKEMVRGLQIEINKQYGYHIAEDGIFGPNTKNHCPIVKTRSSGNITWLIQAKLFIKDYDLAIDGIFGIDTKNKVMKFQKASGLIADGIVGKNTFEKLFK